MLPEAHARTMVQTNRSCANTWPREGLPARERRRAWRAQPLPRQAQVAGGREGTREHTGAHGAPPKNRPAGGHVAARDWSARGGVRPRRPRRGSAACFCRSSRPGVWFFIQKQTTAHVCSSFAPVRRLPGRFSSGFHYRLVEEDVTDAREVGCMQGGPWHARKLLGIFLAPLPL